MIDFKDAGIKPLSGLEIELRNITEADWSNYVLHIVKAGELFLQYGCEPTEDLIECINTMTPNVIYYSVYLKQKNIMVGYVGVTPETSNLEFYVFQEFRKMGIGTDALNLLIWLWFSGQITGDKEEKIEAETLSQNLASVRLLEKLGFQKESVGLRMILSEDASYQTISLYSYVLKSDVACETQCTK